MVRVDISLDPTLGLNSTDNLHSEEMAKNGSEWSVH